MANSGVLQSLKNKMQSLRDELEKYKDLVDEKDAALEIEKKKSYDVGWILAFFSPCQLCHKRRRFIYLIMIIVMINMFIPIHRVSALSVSCICCLILIDIGRFFLNFGGIPNRVSRKHGGVNACHLGNEHRFFNRLSEVLFWKLPLDKRMSILLI